MTIGLLNQLHDHKLAQIRARAQKQIELWREAIAVVKKAEQESKCINKDNGTPKCEFSRL